MEWVVGCVVIVAVVLIFGGGYVLGFDNKQTHLYEQVSKQRREIDSVRCFANMYKRQLEDRIKLHYQATELLNSYRKANIASQLEKERSPSKD